MSTTEPPLSSGEPTQTPPESGVPPMSSPDAGQVNATAGTGYSGFSSAGASASGAVGRIVADAHKVDGYSANMSVLGWINLAFGLIVYTFKADAIGAHAKVHNVRAVNSWITAAVASFGLSWMASIALNFPALVTFVVLLIWAAISAGVAYIHSQSANAGPSALPAGLAWVGAYALGFLVIMLLGVGNDSDPYLSQAETQRLFGAMFLVVVGAVLSTLIFVAMVAVNIVRARVGKPPVSFGFPILHVFSEHNIR